MPPSVTSSGLAWRHSWPTRECARCPPSGSVGWWPALAMAPPPRSRPELRPLVSDSAASLDRRRPRGAGGPGAAGADRAPLRPAGALPPRLQDQAGAAPHTRRAAPARPGRVGAGVRDLVADPLDPAHASAAAPPPGLLRARRRDPDRRPTGVQLPRTG